MGFIHGDRIIFLANLGCLVHLYDSILIELKADSKGVWVKLLHKFLVKQSLYISRNGVWRDLVINLATMDLLVRIVADTAIISVKNVKEIRIVKCPLKLLFEFKNPSILYT